MGKGNVEQLSLYLQNEFPAIFGFVLWRHHVETVKDAYDFGFVSLAVGYDEEELEDALEQNITCFFIILALLLCSCWPFKHTIYFKMYVDKHKKE